MSLPILESATYSTVIPSTGKPVKYRPYLVREEKILLIAQESADTKAMMNAMREVIHACTFGKIEMKDLTGFDLEFLFLQLRSKSVGENAAVQVPCSACKTLNPVDINVSEIQVDFPVNQSTSFMLTDSVGVKLKWLTVDSVESLADFETAPQAEIMNDLVIASIDSIFTNDAVYPANQSTKEELTAFIESLNRGQMEKIEEFIANTPKLQHEVKFKCKCGCENAETLQGLKSFFG